MLEQLIRNSCLDYMLVSRVTEYFKDEKHQKEFEEWYKKKYGKEYEAKKVNK